MVHACRPEQVAAGVDVRVVESGESALQSSKSRGHGLVTLSKCIGRNLGRRPLACHRTCLLPGWRPEEDRVGQQLPKVQVAQRAP